MYDTVSVVLSPVPRELPRAKAWQQVRIEDNPRTGERRTKRVLNTHLGLHLTLADDARLIAERSLPKALRGENVHDLAHTELPAAIAAVDRELAALLRADLPSVADWQPVRADYCRNLRRESEDAVRQELVRLADVELPYKGRPVRGQAGTVAWPKGYIRPKAYSKLLESGQEAARGLLRFEVGVFRLRGFRRVLGLQPGESVQLRDVLTPATHTRVLAEYEGLLWRSPLTERELQDDAYMQHFVHFMRPRGGVKRAMQLLGFSVLWLVYRRPSLQSLIDNPDVLGVSRATVYRYIKDMADWRQEAAQLEGREVPPLKGIEEVEAELARLGTIARRGGQAPRPAA